MKKSILIVLLVVTMLLLFNVSLASANGGPHGGYTATTDACAGCHRAHTATGPRLLMATNTYNLCTSCHSAAGSGANTNVDDGKYLSSRDDAAGDYNHGAANTPDNSDTLAGGFVNVAGVAVTSTHTTDGSSIGAWGDGVNRGVQGAAMAISCATCHDPHGSTNYRIMRTTINATAVTVTQVDEGAAKDYDTEQWGGNQSQVCAACHGNYHLTAAGQGSIVDAGTYTHRIDMAWNTAFAGANNPETLGFDGVASNGDEVPLDGTLVACQTCHYSHGTAASMTTLADGPNFAGSNLLRLDNRGVCQSCHQK